MLEYILTQAHTYINVEMSTHIDLHKFVACVLRDT
jgi:hypothetical protein